MTADKLVRHLMGNIVTTFNLIIEFQLIKNYSECSNRAGA